MSPPSTSSNTPEPLDARLKLELPTFEGPLDLLLHLVQKHELDIVDLPIAFVTERYLDYVRLMERLDLDIASEYLVMAATLAHIKSKMLLPQEPDDQADELSPEEEIDPRAELIRRLLEYQKYKAAAEELGSRGVQGRDTFLRGTEAPEAAGPAPLAAIGLFKLLDAFQAVLKRAKADLAFQITAEGVSIQDRMTQLAERLKAKKRCTFEELFDDAKTVYDVVVTFLALLEMAKRRLARVYQSEPIAPIHLEYTVLDTEDEAAGAAQEESAAAQEESAAAREESAAAREESAAAREESAAAQEESAAAREESTTPDAASSAAHDESAGARHESTVAPSESTVAPSESTVAPPESAAAPDEAEVAPLDLPDAVAHDARPRDEGAPDALEAEND